MSSLDDLLTTAKNLVVAVNGFATTYLQVNGQRSVQGLTSATQIKIGAGRLCTINVLVAGSANGSTYDSSSTGAAAAANQLTTIPQTVGPITPNMPFTNGLVVTPGTGQTISVSYS